MFKSKLRKGCQVKLVRDYASFSDAADGPLGSGKISVGSSRLARDMAQTRRSSPQRVVWPCLGFGVLIAISSYTTGSPVTILIGWLVLAVQMKSEQSPSLKANGSA